MNPVSFCRVNNVKQKQKLYIFYITQIILYQIAKMQENEKLKQVEIIESTCASILKSSRNTVTAMM